jgi:RNA polymerase sigma-70 factor, ECF subfamily
MNSFACSIDGYTKKLSSESVSMDENNLIRAAKQGDREAYNQLVLLYQDAAYSYAYSIMQDPQAAEDCTQDGFLRAYLHLQAFRGGSFRAYVLKIVRNACFDELRRNKRFTIIPKSVQKQDGEIVEQMDLLVDPGSSVEEKVEQIELSSLLYRHLDALPDNYRSVLYLVDIWEFEYVEASLILNIPIGTVKSRLARGRLLLSKSLSRKKDLLPQSIYQSTYKEVISR